MVLIVMSNQRFFKIVCFRFPTNVTKKIEYIRFWNKIHYRNKTFSFRSGPKIEKAWIWIHQKALSRNDNSRNDIMNRDPKYWFAELSRFPGPSTTGVEEIKNVTKGKEDDKVYRGINYYNQDIEKKESLIGTG